MRLGAAHWVCLLCLGCTEAVQKDPTHFIYVYGDTAESPTDQGGDDSGEAETLRPLPDRVSGLAAGWGHSCELSTSGEVSCWGRDSHGQATSPSGKFLQISAGHLHNCGLRENGTLFCWGNNTDGETEPPSGQFIQVDTAADFRVRWTAEERWPVGVDCSSLTSLSRPQAPSRRCLPDGSTPAVNERIGGSIAGDGMHSSSPHHRGWPLSPLLLGTGMDVPSKLRVRCTAGATTNTDKVMFLPASIKRCQQENSIHVVC